MRIAIVNDLPIAVEAMRRVLATAPQHTLAWIARDGVEAVAKCAADTPDLVLMDLIMPTMDGVEATRRIMGASPCAILVVTATMEGNSGRVYEALGAGALDAVQTPALGQGAGLLLVKLDMFNKRIMAAKTHAPFPVMAALSVDGAGNGVSRPAANWLVGIGASAGGPSALAKVLSGLTSDFPGAIVIVQHIDTAFSAGFISWLGGQCRLPVLPVTHGVNLLPGHVYVAGGDKHVVINRAGGLAQVDEPRGIYLPSIDVFFQSIALNWQKACTGVLLTGMGRDGALGLRDLRRAGFVTVTQDRESSAVYGMPKAAAELDAASHVLPLDQVSAHLRQLARDFPRAPARGTFI